jgi:hypothetical protein
MSRRIARAVLSCVALVAVLWLASGGAAAASAGVNATAVTATLDGDDDGHVSRATLVVHVDTTCPGCYDDGGLLGDPEMEPTLEISVGDETETIDGLPNADNHTVRHVIDVESVLDDERESVSVTVTLFDDDMVGRDRVDRRRLTVDLERLDADETPPENRTFAYAIRNTTRCGTVCGEATAVFENVDNESHDNITVAVAMVAGDNEVWSNERSVGTLGANETTTVTQRVELGALEIIDVRSNDMALTVRIVTTYDEGSEVLIERLDLG